MQQFQTVPTFCNSKRLKAVLKFVRRSSDLRSKGSWTTSDDSIPIIDWPWRQTSRSTFVTDLFLVSRSQKHRNTSNARSLLTLSPLPHRLLDEIVDCEKKIRPRIASSCFDRRTHRLKCHGVYIENIGESIIEHLFREWYFFSKELLWRNIRILF